MCGHKGGLPAFTPPRLARHGVAEEETQDGCPAEVSVTGPQRWVRAARAAVSYSGPCKWVPCILGSPLSGPSHGGSSLGGPELLLEVAELSRGFRDGSDCLGGRTFGGSRSARRAPGGGRRRWASRAEGGRGKECRRKDERLGRRRRGEGVKGEEGMKWKKEQEKEEVRNMREKRRVRERRRRGDLAGAKTSSSKLFRRCDDHELHVVRPVSSEPYILHFWHIAFFIFLS